MKALHALIIDDNAQNRDIIGRLLAKQGFQTTEAADAQSLDSLLETLVPVDIVFLDLELPGRNGFEILRRMKADARFEHVPIVACTVHLNEINRAHQQGFHSFLGKPLDAGRFPEQVARILDGERVWESG
ncbi:MAG: response regulator [Anaerolineae bacterium]|nr:response regulator [Anaerolineae bacterium]